MFNGENFPLMSLRVLAGTHTVQKSNTPLRWPGVYFDRKLKFKQHVCILAAKALIVGNALRSLGKTTHGVSPIFLQRAVTACVLKKAYFAAETWWPDRSRTVGNKRISNLVDLHVRLLEKVVLTSARAILLVYRTTQTTALYREARLKPPEIELNLASQTFAARTVRLDPNHPLLIRVNKIVDTKRGNTRLARLVLALPKTESVDPIAYPPWIVRESRSEVAERIFGPQGRVKEKAVQGFIDFLATVPPKDIQVFLDGQRMRLQMGPQWGVRNISVRNQDRSRNILFRAQC